MQSKYSHQIEESDYTSDNLRFGDVNHRRILEKNSWPIEPKTELPLEINNPSFNSFIENKNDYLDQTINHSFNIPK